MINGSVKFVMNSARVLPRQIRLPPKNGQNANELLVVPSGLKNIGDLGSNLSGS